jgi:hypothetical protein
MRKICLLCYLSVPALSAFTQAIPLTDVPAQPGRGSGEANRGLPRPATLALSDGTLPALRFVTDAAVFYPVPAGQRSFSGILAYDAQGNQLDNLSGEPTRNHIRVKFELDGATAFESCLDEFTPPLRIAFPILPGRTLRVVAQSHFTGGSFYLAGAKFQPETLAAPQAAYLPAPGTAYVDIFPQTRHAMFHVFRPGETIPVGVSLGGTAQRAEITLETDVRHSSKLVATLKNGAGHGDWRVPEIRGPARLRIEARIGGRVVFERNLAIAIVPEVDPAGVSDSTFGVHTSWTSHLRVTDEFAHLWGAKWERLEFDWRTMERTPGQYDFSEFDELVNAILAQHMKILCVIGERTPEWAGLPGPAYDAAWAAFAAAAVRHFHGRIEYWDLFNEPNSKYRHWEKEQHLHDPDLPLLKAGLRAVREADPGARIVCCSTQVSDWLPYNKRLFDAGLLDKIDVVSLHAYPTGPPEQKDGFLTSLEALDRLEGLVRSYGTAKPLWNSESNWIVGPEGGEGIRNSHLSEHDQAEFLVRVNLLYFSRGVPFFTHSPFYHHQRRQLHLDTLAAYTNMTSMLNGARRQRLLTPAPGVYGVIAERDRDGKFVGALWTADSTAKLKLSGIDSPHFFDFYGNPIAPPEVFTPEPVYFSSTQILTPKITVVSQSGQPQWKPFPEIAAWKRGTASQYVERSHVLHVTSAETTFSTLLASPVFAVEPGACYLFRANARIVRGMLAISAQDAGGARRGPTQYLTWIPGDGLSAMVFRFYSGASTELKLNIQAANNLPAVSEFEITSPEVAKCVP